MNWFTSSLHNFIWSFRDVKVIFLTAAVIFFVGIFCFLSTAKHSPKDSQKSNYKKLALGCAGASAVCVILLIVFFVLKI